MRCGGWLSNPRWKFTLHDLRRTFITVAESLEIPGYAVKRPANHKMGRDIAAEYIIYIISDVERLRVPMEKISDYLVKVSCLTTTERVVSLREAVPKPIAAEG